MRFAIHPENFSYEAFAQRTLVEREQQQRVAQAENGRAAMVDLCERGLTNSWRSAPGAFSPGAGRRLRAAAEAAAAVLSD